MKFKSSVFLILFLTIIIGLTQSHAGQLFEQEYEQAIEQVKTGETSQAIRSLTTSREFANGQEIAKAENALGWVYFTQGDSRNAITHLSKAETAVAPGSSLNLKIINNLGIVYYSQGNLKQSLEYFTKSKNLGDSLPDKYIPLINQQIKSNKVTGHIRNGINWRFRLDFLKAIEEYTFALEIDPENVRALKFRGYANLRQALLPAANASDTQNFILQANADMKKAYNLNSFSWDIVINLLKLHCVEKDLASIQTVLERDKNLIEKRGDYFSGDGELKTLCDDYIDVIF